MILLMALVKKFLKIYLVEMNQESWVLLTQYIVFILPYIGQILIFGSFLFYQELNLLYVKSHKNGLLPKTGRVSDFEPL